MKNCFVETIPTDGSTIDILHTPLAAQGLRSAYCIAGRPSLAGEEVLLNVFIELLLPVARIQEFENAANRLGEAHTNAKSRLDVVHDFGGVPWCYVEAIAPRPLAYELIMLAQEMGCERRPHLM